MSDDELNKFKLFVKLSSDESNIDIKLLEGFIEYNELFGFNSISVFVQILYLIKDNVGTIEFLERDYKINLDDLFLKVLLNNFQNTPDQDFDDAIISYLCELSPLSIRRFYEERVISGDQVGDLLSMVVLNGILLHSRDESRHLLFTSLNDIPDLPVKVRTIIKNELDPAY